MLNSVSKKDSVGNTMVMAFMLNRSFNFYHMIYQRLTEIFEKHSIEFNKKFELFTSDSEPALIQFGSLFQPTLSLRCVFHQHKEKFNSYALKLENRVIEIENTASIPLILNLN